MRLFEDLRAMRRSIAELRSTDAVEEEKATFELAASAYRFSRDTKATLDDKLSFSATLMRAGEVQAAARLIVELEDDVHEEEVALVEVINEVHAARSSRREKLTRLRLARLLATSMLGACVMAFSAMGIGLAGMFAERSSPKPARIAAADLDRRGHADGKVTKGTRGVKHISIGGTVVALSRSQLIVFRDLQKGKIDPASLEDFLASLPSSVVDSVRMMYLTVTDPAEAVVESVQEEPAAKDVGAATKSVKETEEEPEAESPSPPPPPEDDSDPNTNPGGVLNDTRVLP